MTNTPDDFLLKEYEMLWKFTAQLHRERREAVRFLLAALPGIPAALFASVSIWAGRGTPGLSVADAAPWMLPLLAFLYLVGWSYFIVMTRSRARAVEYTRWLNLVRDCLTTDGQGHPREEQGDYRKKLECLQSGCLSSGYPSYLGHKGVDFCYAVLVALANSAVFGAFFFFLFSRRQDFARGAWRGSEAAVVSLVVMLVAYCAALVLREWAAKKRASRPPPDPSPAARQDPESRPSNQPPEPVHPR